MDANGLSMPTVYHDIVEKVTQCDACVTPTMFEGLCSDLFDKTDSSDTKITTNELFQLFDKDQDGVLNKAEISVLIERWLPILFKPRAALIVVDVQHDFIDGNLSVGGGLSKQNPYEVVPAINQLIGIAGAKFHEIIYTRDWHPDNHISFHDNVHLRSLAEPRDAAQAALFDHVTFKNGVKQILWPRHCVQNTWGAQLHDDMHIASRAKIVDKGTNPELDSYSAFFDNNKTNSTELCKILLQAAITDVYVCGLAYDICVAATAKDALDLGYRTAIVEDCCRGLDEKKIKECKEDLIKRHGMVMQTKDVPDYISAKRRSNSWGLAGAKQAIKI